MRRLLRRESPGFFPRVSCPSLPSRRRRRSRTRRRRASRTRPEGNRPAPRARAKSDSDRGGDQLRPGEGAQGLPPLHRRAVLVLLVARREGKVTDFSPRSDISGEVVYFLLFLPCSPAAERNSSPSPLRLDCNRLPPAASFARGLRRNRPFSLLRLKKQLPKVSFNRCSSSHSLFIAISSMRHSNIHLVQA